MDPYPYLDLARPGFSTRGADVAAARKEGWCARTPYGWAVLRHREAGQLLRDRRLRQGSHGWPEIVGLEGSFAKFWKRSVISHEGPHHKTLRRIAQAALAEDYILSMDPAFEALAESLVSRLARTPEFDFLDSFSAPFAAGAITLLLDLPAGDAPGIGRDASTLGRAMGLDAKSHENEVNAACDRLQMLAAGLIAAPTGTGFVTRLLQAAEAEGVRDLQTLVDLVVIAIFGGVDTTRAQLAFLIALMGEHPDQWAWLRQHPEAIPAAIAEAIRIRPTTTWATREATEPFDFGDVRFRPGEMVHILVHAASTDPATGHDGTFDIRAERRLHFGFGGGAHHCLGHFVARTDMAAALRVLLRAWQVIGLARPPEFLPETGNTAPRHLEIAPVRADPSAGEAAPPPATSPPG